MNIVNEHINYNTPPYMVLKLLTLLVNDPYLKIIEKILTNKIKCEIYYTNDNVKEKNNSIILTNDKKNYLDAEYGTLCYIKTPTLNFSVYYNRSTNSHDIKLNKHVVSVPLSKMKALFKIRKKRSLKGGASAVVQQPQLPYTYYMGRYEEFKPLQLMYLDVSDDYIIEHSTHRQIIGETTEFYMLHAFFNYLERNNLMELLTNIESHLLYIMNTYNILPASTLFEAINHMVTYIECEHNINYAQRIIVPIEPIGDYARHLLNPLFWNEVFS